MAGKRKKHSSTYKAKVALEAIKGRHTVRELAARYEIHPTLINNWKRQLLEEASEVFEHGRPPQMDASALYEPPFSSLHAGGPDELFAGKAQVIEGVFKALESCRPDESAASG